MKKGSKKPGPKPTPKIKADLCPECGSDDLEIMDSEYVDSKHIAFGSCLNCDCEFKQVFELVSVGVK